MTAAESGSPEPSIEPFSGASPASPPEVGNRHWPGLLDVAQVPTGAFRLSQVQLEHAANLRGVAAVDGPSGCGKTFAVDHFLHHSDLVADRPIHWIQLPYRPNVKAVMLMIASAIGADINRREVEYNITEDLVAHLIGSDRVIAVDEAHHSSTNGLQQLRYLHDRCTPNRPGDPVGFTLILVGAGVHRHMAGAAELKNRVSTKVTFAPLGRRDLLAAVREWNPLLRDLPPQMLLDLDRNYCHGNWREWSVFLASYIRVCRDAGVPTTEAEQVLSVKAAIRQMEGAGADLTSIQDPSR